MSKKYRAKGFPGYIVSAEQFIPGKPLPDGMHLWGEKDVRPRDGSFGYVNAPTPIGWQSVCAYDWVIVDNKGSHQRLDNETFHELYEPIEHESEKECMKEAIEITDYEEKFERFKYGMRQIILAMKAQYAVEADNAFKTIGKMVVAGRGEDANGDAIKAACLQAKINVLNELLEKIESEE